MRAMTSLIVLFAVCALTSCALTGPAVAQQPSAKMPGMGPNPTLPQPDQTSSVHKYSYIVGWPEGRTPTSPPGFRVTAFARGLDSPRWLYVLPNGDVLVAEARSHPKSDQPATHRQGMIGAGSIGVSANRIALLRDEDRDGVAETRSVLLQNLNQPFGMALVGETTTGALWTAVNERDHLGDDLVPDYITSVREDGFYGWPYSYFGKNEDPRQEGRRPDLVARAIVPDYALGSHTASLGLAFHNHSSFPERYRGGAFIGQHGSWNRSRFSGYKVVFVPFRDGKPAGPLEDFLTGFMANPQTGEAHGRPVGLAVVADGSLLVADDAGNTVWRVQAVR